MWNDELAGWFKNFNRYNKGSDEEYWLKLFNANPSFSDRKGVKNSVYISRPFISVVGTIQNGILNELAQGSRSSNGFIDRLLFVMPNNQDKQPWSDKEPTFDIESSFHIQMPRRFCEWISSIASGVASEIRNLLQTGTTGCGSERSFRGNSR